MKPLVFLLLLIGLSAHGQKHTLSGKIQGTSFHQGGVAHADPVIPYAYQERLYVVRYVDSITLPVIVASFQPDQEGNFIIQLKPGTYGLITEEDKNALKPGQFYPAGYMSSDEWVMHSINWETNVPFPLDLREDSIAALEFTRAESSICYLCP